MSARPEDAAAPDESRSGRRRPLGRRAPRPMMAALSAWLGAVLLFGAVVAPAAFAVLPSRSDAGALAGRVLPVLFIAGIVIGLLLVAGAVLPAMRPLARRSLAVGGLTMMLACGAAQLWVGPRLAAVRATAGVLDRRPPDDPIRAEFGRLHGVSVALLGVAALAGTAVLVLASLSGRRPG